MIELIAARGNTSLESAVSLTKSLRWDIESLGVRISKAVSEEENSARRNSSGAKSQAQEMLLIVKDMKQVVARIEDAVPLINLAITTSGVNLSTNLPASVSPSRLLQASLFLNAGDSQYGTGPSRTVQIGPAFTLSMYMMLYCSHNQQTQDEAGLRTTIWKEVIHKARVKLVRVPLDRVLEFPYPSIDSQVSSNTFTRAPVDPDAYLPSDGSAQSQANEFAYQLGIIEDLDDDRFHTFDDNDEQPSHIDDVPWAGIREIIPIHEVSRIFYADTGKVLNLESDGEANNPVLLIKRDTKATPPRRMMRKSSQDVGDGFQIDEEVELNAPIQSEMNGSQVTDRQTKSGGWRLPPNLDPEWIAFEVYNAEPPDSDSDEEDQGSSRHVSRQSVDTKITSALSSLQFSPNPPSSSTPPPCLTGDLQHPESISPSAQQPALAALPTTQIQTRLSLLEMLIRLTSLQQFQQASHLTITDELLNYFLEDASTTGAAPGDVEARKRIRMEARARVGFDPYDESPVKRRGEDYQSHGVYPSRERSHFDDPLAETDVDARDERQAHEDYERGYDAAWADMNSAARHGRQYTPASREKTPVTPISPLVYRNREQSSGTNSDPVLMGRPQLEGGRGYGGGSGSKRGRQRDERLRETSGLVTPPSTSPATASGLRKSLMPEARVREEVESGRIRGLGSPLARSPERS